MLSEPEIYLRMKGWLREKKWKILGGEPPGGTNDIPIIEIKTSHYHGKGSYGSKKIDLVGYKEGYFIFLELKTKYSRYDIEKLNTITSESVWRRAFIRALNEKLVLERANIILPYETSSYVSSSNFFIKGVGFNYTGKLGEKDYVTFIPSGSTMKPIIGPAVKREARELVEG